jgi:uncharacterized protein (TIGR02217 family)
MSINLVINDFVGDAAFSGFDEANPLIKDKEWQTDVVRYDSKKEQRNQIDEQPTRRWFINWQVLDQAARDKLLELHERAKGRYADFLYADRWDFECGLAESSVTAVGGETTTQLVKEYYNGETEAWSENKTKIQPSAKFAPIVKIDAAVKVEGQNFTLDDATGIIDWTGGAAPNGALGAGEVVTANYYFYFKVRFAEDVHRDIMNHASLWTAAPLEIVEVLT